MEFPVCCAFPPYIGQSPNAGLAVKAAALSTMVKVTRVVWLNQADRRGGVKMVWPLGMAFRCSLTRVGRLNQRLVPSNQMALKR